MYLTFILLLCLPYMHDLNTKKCIPISINKMIVQYSENFCSHFNSVV